LNEFQAKLPIASFTNKSYVAVNMTPLAFTADRRAAVDMDRKAAVPAAAIGRYRLSAGLTAANPPHAAMAGERDRQTDRRTDTVPFHRPCSAYYSANSANNAEDRFLKQLLHRRTQRNDCNTHKKTPLGARFSELRNFSLWTRSLLVVSAVTAVQGS